MNSGVPRTVTWRLHIGYLPKPAWGQAAGYKKNTLVANTTGMHKRNAILELLGIGLCIIGVDILEFSQCLVYVCTRPVLHP
jgi:hypothetical protein